MMTFRGCPSLLIPIALLAACAAGGGHVRPIAAPPRKTPVREAIAPVAVAESPDEILVEVDGHVLKKSHLADFFLRFRRDASREALTHLVDVLIVEADGDRLGVMLPPNLLEAAVDRTIKARQEEVRTRLAARVSWKQYLEGTLGVAPAAYRAKVGELLGVTMRLDRLIRYEQVRSNRLDVRVIVVATLEEAKSVVRKLGAGADLVSLAEEVSLTEHVAPAPITEDGLSDDLRALLTGLSPGQVSAPYNVEREGRQTWVVYQLVRRLAGRDVPYAAVKEEIEGSLERQPRESWEYEEWARRVRSRHRIEWKIR
jgi:hypothetical protein